MKVSRKSKLVSIITVMAILGLLASWNYFTRIQVQIQPVGMAVEFNDHAACAYVALSKGWYREQGLNFTSFESYATGLSLAAALARGDIQVAYLCLGPALLAYARGVPIKIVSGTHLYGYNLVAKPEIRTIEDLKGKIIGCVGEGSQVDLLLHILDWKYDLSISFEHDVRRANPPQLVMLLQTGKIDAAFLPEHHATIAESLGFKVLVTSQNLWPEMQGSVLVVKGDLIKSSPETVKRLVKVTYEATNFVNDHRIEAAKIVAYALRETTAADLPSAEITQPELITPQIIEKSMNKLNYTCRINPEEIQRCAEILLRLGYIDKPIIVEDVLNLDFLPKEV